jgi:hypothetical protein
MLPKHARGQARFGDEVNARIDCLDPYVMDMAAYLQHDFALALCDGCSALFRPPW